jgi:hypothetical protein
MRQHGVFVTGSHRIDDSAASRRQMQRNDPGLLPQGHPRSRRAGDASWDCCEYPEANQFYCTYIGICNKPRWGQRQQGLDGDKTGVDLTIMFAQSEGCVG